MVRINFHISCKCVVRVLFCNNQFMEKQCTNRGRMHYLYKNLVFFHMLTSV